MANQSFAGQSPVSTEELLALCEEIRALANSGVPFEDGLVQLGRNTNGRIGRIAAEVGRRTAEGETLSTVLADERLSIPPIYQSVIQAGVRSGRLPAAMEGLYRSAKRSLELRQIAGLALVYPMVVVAIACLMACVLLPRWGQDISLAAESLVSEELFFIRFAAVTAWLGRWVWLIPIVLAGLIIWWWRSSSRARSISSRAYKLSWIPGVSRMARSQRLSEFTNLLALLVQNSIPLPEGLVLAGDACGDPAIRTAANELSKQISAGRFSAVENSAMESIPPMLRWSLLGQSSSEELVTTLTNSSEGYRRRAEASAEWLRVYLPLFTSLALGGTVVLLYSLATFVPWFALLHRLSHLGGGLR